MRIFNMDKDSEFDFELLDNIYNSELADTYGNLVRRAGVLAQKKTDGKIYRRNIDSKIRDELENKLKSYIDAMENYEVSKAASIAIDIARLGNQYLNDTKPWEKKDPSKELYTVLETIRLATILLYPFTPRSSDLVARAFGFTIDNPGKGVVELVERYNVSSAPILFKKIISKK
jgi:methionyl-tRNA synthetase (EC 6.1.1.10)